MESIVDTLGERDYDARERIAAVVVALGDMAALELLGETERMERDGGMLVADGSRGRSPSAFFPHLARRPLPSYEREDIFSRHLEQR